MFFNVDSQPSTEYRPTWYIHAYHLNTTIPTNSSENNHLLNRHENRHKYSPVYENELTVLTLPDSALASLSVWLGHQHLGLPTSWQMEEPPHTYSRLEALLCGAKYNKYDNNQGDWSAPVPLGFQWIGSV